VPYGLPAQRPSSLAGPGRPALATTRRGSALLVGAGADGCSRPRYAGWSVSMRAAGLPHTSRTGCDTRPPPICWRAGGPASCRSCSARLAGQHADLHARVHRPPAQCVRQHTRAQRTRYVTIAPPPEPLPAPAAVLPRPVAVLPQSRRVRRGPGPGPARPAAAARRDGSQPTPVHDPRVDRPPRAHPAAPRGFLGADPDGSALVANRPPESPLVLHPLDLSRVTRSSPPSPGTARRLRLRCPRLRRRPYR